MAPVTVLKIFAIVIGVISGDTIVVSVDGQERRIVLAGIDAPEQGQPYFEKARDSLADKIKGKKVFVQVFGKTKDGRDAAAVWLDKRSINAEMVAEGHAWYDPRHPEYKTINKAQKKAKRDMLGLWAGKQPTKVPKDFVICLNFNAERTKGVYVSHDAAGTGLVGLPGKPAGRFTGGDWLIRPKLKPAK